VVGEEGAEEEGVFLFPWLTMVVVVVVVVAVKNLLAVSELYHQMTMIFYGTNLYEVEAATVVEILKTVQVQKL
jgi:hypothetical protein